MAELKKTLVRVPFDEAVDGEKYLTEMKHGWISGFWDKKTETCSGYYWQDMEWYPSSLWRWEDETE